MTTVDRPAPARRKTGPATARTRNGRNPQTGEEFDLENLDLGELRKRPKRFRDWLENHLPQLLGPTVDAISPARGHRGQQLTISGSNFSPVRTDNVVTIGGVPAFVLRATPTELLAVVDRDTDTGKVEVTVGTTTVTAPVDFEVTGYPANGSGEDGPPVVVTGEGQPGAGDVNPIGDIRVLVVMLQTTDRTPANAATTTTLVTNAWAKVRTFYDQASYTRTAVKFDVTTFGTLDGTFADFVDTSDAVENIRENQQPRVAAIAAQTAVDQGFKLNDYAMLCSVVFTDGEFIRAWGGGSQSTFAYENGLPTTDPNHISINLTADHKINTLFINESADWGRFAHEFGHCIVSAPTRSGDGTATLGEDVYGGGLVDPTAATAANFELMGRHDTHPLFSGYHLDKLGYYAAGNVKRLTWDRNPFTEAFEVQAHGLAQDSGANPRVHLVQVKVSNALSYYVQVRQRPGTTAQVFDDNIPVNGAVNQGGVVVTRVISGEMHNNQQTRFITLMHDDRVLITGDSVEDPARALKITVEDTNVQARPQVCRVRVAWAQTVVDDPNGAFDLNVEPWDDTYRSPDVWVDRDPFGTLEEGTDGSGHPIGNGDKPMVGAVNQFTARVHCSGAMGASNVNVTFYAVTPPGVGDNGNWAPMAVKTIPSIAANSSADVFTNWVPVVGKHTCLKVFAHAQLGEISGRNNLAQENVSKFQSPGGSPCDPVLIRTAIRNPLPHPSPVLVELHGVPAGWAAQLPHQWVMLDGLGEREFDVAIWPTEDFAAYQLPRREQGEHGRGKLPALAPLRIAGQIPRAYDVTQHDDGSAVASRFSPIGGTFNQVEVRHHASIVIKETQLDGDMVVFGAVSPAAAKQRVVVHLTAPDGRVVAGPVTETESSGSFRLAADVRDVLDEVGPGTYGIQAFVFDADYLADATSNLVQRTV